MLRDRIYIHVNVKVELIIKCVGINGETNFHWCVEYNFTFNIPRALSFKMHLGRT